MIFLIVLLFLVIAGLEIPGLMRNKMWRELIVFAGLMSAGMTISILQVMDITIPNPNQPVEMVFKPLVQWIMGK